MVSARHVDLVQAVPLGQGRIVQRVVGVAGLGEVARRRRTAVLTMSRPPGLRSREMHLERGRVHGHQAVEPIARRVHALAAELELKARHSEQGARRGANLGGEVRERGDVVSRPGRLRGELLARELHAVAGVAGEADHRAIQFLPRLPGTRDGSRRLAHRFSLSRVKRPDGRVPTAVAHAGSRHLFGIGMTAEAAHRQTRGPVSAGRN